MVYRFSKLWWIFILSFIALAIGISFLSIDLAVKVLLVIQAISTVLYLCYKLYLPSDKEYAQIAKENGIGKSSYISEMLPLQLCNMGYVMIPIALITRNHYIMAYCATILPFSTMAAILMPCIGFEHYSIKKFRIIGFFFTHYFLFFEALSMWFTGLYVPNYIDAVVVFVLLVINGTIAHIANTFIRKYTNSKLCNYLYTYSPDGNPVLDFFYKRIKINFLYELPIALGYCIFVFIFICIFRLFI